MKKILSILLALAILSSVFAMSWSVSAETDEVTMRKSKFTGKTYEIVFEDQFEGDGLKDHWIPRNTNYNDSEANSYQNDMNISFKDGIMSLRGSREDKEYDCGAWWGTPRKTTLTGMGMDTNGNLSFERGMIEMKAKFPDAPGVWTTFWSLGQNDGWPLGGEIDIIEHTGGPNPWNADAKSKEYYGTGVHFSNPSDPWTNLAGMNTPPPKGIPSYGKHIHLGEPVQDNFHVYGLEWTKTDLIFYRDHQELNRIPISDAAASPTRHAFFQPHYLVLNFGFGGGNDGDEWHWAGAAPKELFETFWKVDWIRCWQVTEDININDRKTYKINRDEDYDDDDVITATAKAYGVTFGTPQEVIKEKTTKKLTATVYPSIAANKAVTWLSSDTSVATVDTNGIVSALKPGKVKITATTVDGGFTAVCDVTVIPARGDINNDNVIDVEDLLLLKKHILQINPLKGTLLKNADINGDNKVDVEDLLLLKKYCLKIIDKFD